MIAERVRSTALGEELRAAIYATSLVWIVLAGGMALCGIVDLYVGDREWQVFFAAAASVVTVAGLLALATRASEPKTTERFGFLLVVLFWFTGPLAGALPFVFAGMSVTDAVFETVSGFTTTGSTVIAGLDTKPPGILLWRSFTHWFGGIGILALTVVLLPFLRIGGMQLFSKESSDRSEKPLPRFASFARGLLAAYTLLTALCFIAYEIAGMSPWEALNHAMSTLSTGGFSTHDSSLAWFDSTPILWVATVFMFVGALPISLFVALLFGRRPGEIDPQVLVLLVILFLSAVTLAATREGGFGERQIAEAFFNVMSVISTTGFAAGDYTLWSAFAPALFYVLTYLGGAAGSTAGGVKTYRIIVVFALLKAHLERLVHPHAVSITRYGRRAVDPAIFRAAFVFLVAYAVVLLMLTMAVSLCGVDFMTAHTGVLTALSNVGPGLGSVIGPAGNFAPLPDAAKWILALAMLLGRLEILPVLVLLIPDFWRR